MDDIIDDYDRVVLKQFLEGSISITCQYYEEEIFKYKDKFYHYLGEVWTIISDRREAIRTFFRLLFIDDHSTFQFDLGNILKSIKGKRFFYKQPYIYYNDDLIVTKDFKRVDLLEFIDIVYEAYCYRD